MKIFSTRNNHETVAEIFTLLFLCVLLLNAMVVAAGEPNCTRYFCYTQFLLYCFGGYIAERLFSYVPEKARAFT